MPVTSKKRAMLAEDLYRFKLITDARVSPDGEHIIYALQRVDRESERRFSNLWLHPVKGGRSQQFTYGDQVDASPRWSPDGKLIAFLSNRSDDRQPQLYVIPLGGGEARPLTDLKADFGEFAWSPDGKQLLCNLRLKDKEQIERQSDERKKKLGVVVRHITDTLYKLDGAGYLPKERWHIWTVEVRNGKGTQLTTGGIHHELGPSYSPDGSHITFISNRAEKPDLEPGKDDLFVMPSAGGEAARIPTPEGAKMSPVYSPDGKWIAYIGMDGRGEYWRNLDLWIVPADGSAPARDLTGNDDLHVMSFTSTDCGDGLMMPPTWSPDSRKIYFQVTRHGDTALMSLSIEDAAPAAAREIDTGGILGPYSFDESGERLAYVINTPGNPSRLYIRDGQKGRSRRLTRLNDGWLSRVDLGQLEEVWFEARDGHKLHGWILKPPGFDPAKKYPSIMQIHGGPHVQYGRGFMHEFYFLSGQGYVVYFSNPRGGQGYGEMHCKAIWNDWGTVDYDDVMDWAEFINAKPYIDSDRRGVTGGSYGGYMTNLIIGRTDQFKAAVTQRSVSNMLSMWGSSDGNWRFQMSYGDDMPPFDHVEKYWGASPMKYIGNAKTPTLVIHSEQDLRAAQEQGEQIYVALRKLGVDSELLLFPDEPHGLSRVGRTDRRVTRLTHMVRWFDKYLK